MEENEMNKFYLKIKNIFLEFSENHFEENIYKNYIQTKIEIHSSTRIIFNNPTRKLNLDVETGLVNKSATLLSVWTLSN
jgi:hypothetical protein